MGVLQKTIIIIFLMFAIIYIDKLFIPNYVPRGTYPDIFYNNEP